MITDKRIIYPNESGISVLIPSPQWKGTIEELAAKDVPEGVPYLIVNESDVPENREQRILWDADFSTPDGVGGNGN